MHVTLIVSSKGCKDLNEEPYARYLPFVFWFVFMITGYWIWFPVLYGRTLLFIHSIYNSLHLLVLNSQSTPTPSFDNSKSILYIYESIPMSYISSFVWYFRFSGTPPRGLMSTHYWTSTTGSARGSLNLGQRFTWFRKFSGRVGNSTGPRGMVLHLWGIIHKTWLLQGHELFLVLIYPRGVIAWFPVESVSVKL